MNGFPQTEHGQGWTLGVGTGYLTRNTAKYSAITRYLTCSVGRRRIPYNFLYIFHRGCENFAGDVTNSGWGNVIFLIFTEDQYYLLVPVSTSEGAFFTYLFAGEFAGACLTRGNMTGVFFWLECF